METQVKGNSFRTLLAAVEALRGAEARERVEKSLSEDALLRLRGVVAGGWYPMSFYADIHECIAEVCGSGEALARDIGRQATQWDLKGFARILLKFASPKQALGGLALIGSKYYKGASVRVVEATDQRAHLVCSDFVGSSALVWAEFAGGMETIAEAAGGKAVRVHKLSGGGAEPEAEFMVHWLSD